MNKENSIKLWKIIQLAGEDLKGQLPDHPNHPKEGTHTLMLLFV